MFHKLLKKIVSLKNRPRRYWHIFRAIKRIRPHRIMEIGTWSGDRALKMIKLAQKYYPYGEVEYYGFDLFELMTLNKFSNEVSKWPPSMAEVKTKLESTGARIFLYRGDTVDILPSTLKNLPKMDLIFIDGGHSLETIANDWLYSSMLMHSKTITIFDDYWLNRSDAGARISVDSINRNEYNVKKLLITDHFKKTVFGELTIKLVQVTRK